MVLLLLLQRAAHSAPQCGLAHNEWRESPLPPPATIFLAIAVARYCYCIQYYYLEPEWKKVALRLQMSYLIWGF